MSENPVRKNSEQLPAIVKEYKERGWSTQRDLESLTRSLPTATRRSRVPRRSYADIMPELAKKEGVDFVILPITDKTSFKLYSINFQIALFESLLSEEKEAGRRAGYEKILAKIRSYQ